MALKVVVNEADDKVAELKGRTYSHILPYYSLFQIYLKNVCLFFDSEFNFLIRLL